MNNFWQKSNKPILALAPMAGFTDSAFRQICKEFGADVLYSEMASVSAICYGSEKTFELLAADKKEKPYVVQLFGAEPKKFEEAMKFLGRRNEEKGRRKMIFDGIDINLGCPVPKVAKQGAGAELFKNLKLSKEVIKAVIGATDLPISIKVRVKAGEVDVLKFLDYMSDLDIKAVMIHGRTLKQGFSGPIDTAIIKKARNYFGGVILANGGIEKAEDAQRILRETEADGVGIGRGALGRPWIFQQIKDRSGALQCAGTKIKNNEEIFKVALKHAELVHKLKGDAGIREMRKHLCWYMRDFDGASELRKKLVHVETLRDIKNIFSQKSIKS